MLPLAIGIPVAAVIAYLLIWYGPDGLAGHDIGSVTGLLRTLRLQEARTRHEDDYSHSERACPLRMR